MRHKLNINHTVICNDIGSSIDGLPVKFQGKDNIMIYNNAISIFDTVLSH